MIYSFSPEAKLEWFPSSFYPPEDENANKQRLPGGPRNKYEWSDGFVEGFPIGMAFNELVQFDLKAFANHDASDYLSKVNSDILQWEEQECVRLEQNRMDSDYYFPYEPLGGINKGLKPREPSTRYCDRNVFTELTDQKLTLLRLRFSAIENKKIAEKCFQRKIVASDVSLWVLSQLDYYHVRRDRKNSGTRIIEKSADKLELLISYIADFSSLRKVFQTAESFRIYCEKELCIVFRFCYLPHFEKVFIALFEAALEILKEDCRYHVGSKEDIDGWINARTVDLIQLCGSRDHGWCGVSPSRLCAKHDAIIHEFNNLANNLEEERLLSDEARLYIDLGVTVGKIIEARAEKLQGELKDNYRRRPTLRDLEKYGVEIEDDFHIASAISTSTILANTFSASSIEELVAYMAYAAIKQGQIPRMCPNCRVPFIKIDNRQTYCSKYCRTEHAKVPDGKKSPAKARQNIQEKYRTVLGGSSLRGDYFKCVLKVLNGYWKEYQSNADVDTHTYYSWVKALNCFKTHQIEATDVKIECILNSGRDGRKRRCNPLIPLIIDGRLLAVSFADPAVYRAIAREKLPKTSNDFFNKRWGEGTGWFQELDIKKECKKGRANEELSDLLALGPLIKIHDRKPQER